jgi:Phytanoyl-CoA dioxygenase (PhyH)
MHASHSHQELSCNRLSKVATFSILNLATSVTAFSSSSFSHKVGHMNRSLLNAVIDDTVKASEHHNVLSEEQLQTFDRDGVILVRGLVKGEELKAAIEAVSSMGKKSHEFLTAYKNIEFQSWRTSNALKDVALFSDVPKAAAQLINRGVGKSGREGPVRLLKDAVLCYSPDNKGCGWHVDDKFFWPCYDGSTGINVWIALSPMSAKRGGGLAVSPGSHKEKFAQDSIPIIVAGGTCGMETLAPDIHKKLEAMKVLYDMEPGDAIIHDRWLFHRSEKFQGTEETDVVLNRYSIRYMPADAKAFDNGYDEVYKDEKYKGMDGQPLEQFNGYYPQVFPTTIASELV